MRFLALQLLACWPVWRWYGARLTDGSDEPWGLVAVALAFALLIGERTPTREFDLRMPATLMLLYALTFAALSPIFRAALALVALSATLRQLGFTRAASPSWLGLMMLSLPVIPSLQFVVGFPLRALVAMMAAPMLQLVGLPVVREGVALRWAEQLIAVDAPCSGVRMLWTGGVLVCALACWLKLTPVRIVAAGLGGIVVIVAANVFRTVGLFFVEAHLIALPAWSHAGLGLLIFALATVALIAMVRSLAPREARCAVAAVS